jgi:hypothetical protein
MSKRKCYNLRLGGVHHWLKRRSTRKRKSVIREQQCDDDDVKTPLFCGAVEGIS